MAFRIQIRRDSALNWQINNPVLLQAEMGYVTDTNQAKFGDGMSPWNDLDYFTPEGNPGPTGATGPSLAVLDNGVQIVTGATGIDFSGPGFTVTNVGSKATVTLDGNVPTTATPTYVLKVKYSSGIIDSSEPFPAAQGPTGASLIGASGWTFTRNSTSELTINHPLNNFAVNLMTHAETSSGTYISRSISGVTAGNYINQLSSLGTINIKGLDGTNTGINTNSGPFYMFLTWQFPTASIFI